MTRYISLLDNLRVNHGGMTKACLRRCKALDQELGLRSTIVTFNNEPNYASIVAQVRRAPDLGESVVENFFCSLADRRQAKLIGRLAGRPRNVVPIDYARSPKCFHVSGEAYSTTRAIESGNVTLVFYDPDGHAFLILEDRNPTTGKNLVTLLSRGLTKGVLYQGPLHVLKQHWLDHLIGSEPAMLIFDDNRVARSFKDYVRPQVGKIFVQHVSHLEGGETDGVRGKLRKSYRDVFRALGKFDAMVTLSERQESEVRSRLNPATRLVTIPNVNFPPSLEEDFDDKNPKLGVVVTRHAPEKRVLHTVKAFEKALGKDPEIRLIIVGGPTASPHFEEVRVYVDSRGLGGAIELRGHEPQADKLFGRAGFTVLSSTYEGFALVLLEAMGRGVIPVSYDVPYGPRSIIDDGRDGFLADNGSIDQLATRIVRASSESQGSPMRARARDKALCFGPASVASRWQSLFQRISDGFSERQVLMNLEPTMSSFSLSSEGAVVVFQDFGAILQGARAFLRLEAFDSFKFTDIMPLDDGEGSGRTCFKIVGADKPKSAKEPVGLWLHVESGDQTTRHRLQWPGDWPAIFITSSPFGNVNV